MITGLLKLTLLAGLAIVTLGAFPNRRTGSILAIGICVAAAAVIHFAAP
jgi:hypothetical protein